MSEELPEVKRSEILEAIEKGLKRATWIKPEDAERMREFGRTTPLISIGHSHTSEAECPLYAVSIWNRHHEPDSEYFKCDLADFYEEFDGCFRVRLQALSRQEKSTSPFKVVDG